MARLRADYAGMVATVVNGLVLDDALRAVNVPAAVYGALPVAQVVKPFSETDCREELDAGRVVILSGGTGNPLFTTDTCAALRAVQLGVQVLLKATRVDGVYSADPEVEPDAVLYKQLTYREVLERSLGVMDLCAVNLCREHRMPLGVFNYATSGSIRRALAGEPIGTAISDGE
jgi:uridylate kinase